MATYKYVSPEGVIVPDTSSILKDTNGEWTGVFGEGLNVNEETPQGVIIAGDVLVRSEVVANNAALANQINPNYAGGIFLDDLWALTGGKRRSSSYSLVDGVELRGIPGVSIASGTRRRTTSGNLFQLIDLVQLDNTGYGVGRFQSIDPGPVECLANTLTVPVVGYTPPGLESTTNPQAGTPGTLEQTDLSAKQERRQTLALQGRSISEAMMSHVRALSGVKSISFRENTSDSTQVIDGITLVEHSVWICVDGGIDQDIADMAYSQKTAGGAWNGSVSVPVKDPYSGQSSTVKFDHPTAKPIMVRVTASVEGTLTSDPEGIIKSAILQYSLGQSTNGEPGFVLGEDVSPFELAAAVNYSAPVIYVRKVEIAPKAVSPVWTVITMDIGLKEKATISLDDILVVIQ